MMRAISKRLGCERGFTLTELLVVLPTLGLVLGGITVMMTNLMHWNGQTTEQLTQQQTIRPTLDLMMQDIRSSMPPSIGGLSLLAASSTAISFYAPDQLYATSGISSPFHMREVAYRFSGGALQTQSVTSTNTYTTVTSTIPWGTWTSASGNFPLATFPATTGWTTLLGSGLTADNSDQPLSSVTFTYYDGDGDAISSPVSAANLPLVKTIEVDVTATTGGSFGDTTTYSDVATIAETQPTT
jgi:type II secretory pathway component PulJ